MNRTLTVAVVGTGFLARTRLQCWRKVHHATVEVVVASRDRKSAEEFAAANGADRAATIEEAFADPSVTLVDLCVPNHAHAPLCEQAAAAGSGPVTRSRLGKNPDRGWATLSQVERGIF